MNEKATLPAAEDVTEPLSQEQQDAIQAEKDTDWVSPEKVNDEVTPPVKKEDEKPAKKEELSDEQKQEKEAEEQKLKDEAAENERLDKKAKELDKTVDEVVEIEKTDKAEQVRIETVAKEENISVDEVKENEGKDKSVAERHGSDPMKLAKALRKEQSEYGKIKNENEELQTFKTNAVATQRQFDENKFQAVMESKKNEVMDEFKKHCPDQCTDQTDDVVFERAKNYVRQGLKDKEAGEAKVTKEKVESRRSEVMKNLSDDLKEFSAEVKEQLAQVPDNQILNDNFDINALGHHARGKKFTPDYVKSLEDAAYKRGIEQPEISKSKSKPKPSKSGGKPGVTITLDDNDKERAEEIYGRRTDWTKERMWQEYQNEDKGKDF